MGDLNGARPPARLLIIDANVLIDYASADVGVLELVGKHLGEVYVPLPLLAEVDQLDESACERLGLRILEPSPEELIEAGAARGRLSFQDRVCLVLARDRGLTCVTNDRALKAACREASVATLWGLELMIELVGLQRLTAEAAIQTGRAIQVSNPLHITEEILTRFEARLRASTRREDVPPGGRGSPIL